MPDILGRLRTPRLPAAPSAPVVGEMYYDTTTNILYWWNGTVWTSAAGGGGVSGSTKYSYTFSTFTGVPNSQEVRLDAAMGPSVTKLRAHQTSLGTLTMYDLESHAKPGTLLLMVSSNRSYSVFKVTTSALPGGPYVEFGVVYMGSGDVGDAGAGTVSLEVIPGYVLPTGGTTGQVLTKTSATNYAAAWQAAGGGATDLRYNGAWAAGSYTDGDIVIYNGISYIAVRTTTQTPGAWAPPQSPPISYATTLPTSPSDGQEAILVDNVTNPTYQWRFRYNAGNSTSLKWEFVGGPAWMTVGPAQTISVATTWINSTLGVTIPRTGFYKVTFGGRAYNPLTGVADIVGGDDSVALWGRATPGNGQEQGMFCEYQRNMTGGQVYNPRLYCSPSGMVMNSQILTLTPVRVS
jgi:Carbohydrate-binding module family 5/12